MARARFAGLLFLTIRASSKVAYGTGRHPLCKVLEGSGRPPQADKFPAEYTCREDDYGAAVTCVSSTPGIEPKRNSYGSTSEEQRPAADSSSGHATASPIADSSTSAWSIWHVCEGDRDGGTRQGVDGFSWIDCEGYFAIAASLENSGQACSNFRRHGHEGRVRSTTLSLAAARGLASSAEPVVDEAETHVEVPAEAAPEQQQHPVDASTKLATDGNGRVGEDVVRRVDKFVPIRDNDGCDEVWTSWPAVQEAAAAKGTFLMLDLFPSVGNLFITLTRLVKVARLLEVAVVLNWRGFEGFRVAFDPANIMWDLDPSGIVEQADRVARGANAAGAELSKLRSLKFSDGIMILADSQLELLALELGIAGTALDETVVSVKESYPTRLRSLLQDAGQSLHALPPCAWNFLLRRSPSMIETLTANSPWGQPNARPNDYVAWHIRTSDGESARSFSPDVHRYIFHGQSSSDVCPLYLTATAEAEEACRRLFPGGVQDMPIYISSNSKSMSRNCTSAAADSMVRASFVDLGIADSDAHTAFSKNPELTAANAFTDYLFLMDAAMIVRTKSSFSGTVAEIKGLTCHGLLSGEGNAISGLVMCLPPSC